MMPYMGTRAGGVAQCVRVYREDATTGPRPLSLFFRWSYLPTYLPCLRTKSSRIQ